MIYNYSFIYLSISASVEIRLTNPVQSPKEKRDDCSNINVCSAKNAIDGDIATGSQTSYDRTGWWMAEMVRVARIKRIHLYLSDYQLKWGYLSKLTVFTKLYDSDAWTVCKGEFAVKGSIKPYVVKCAQEMNSKYVRISTAYWDGLQLREVNVFGLRIEGNNPFTHKNKIDIN